MDVMPVDRPNIDPKKYPKWVRPYNVGGNTHEHAVTILSIAAHNSDQPSPGRYEIINQKAQEHGDRIRDLPGQAATVEIGMVALAGRLSAMAVVDSIRDASLYGDDDGLAAALTELNSIIWPLTGKGPWKRRLELFKLAREARDQAQLWDGPMLHPGHKMLLKLGTADTQTFPIAVHHLLRDTGRHEARHRSTRLADALDNLENEPF